VPATVTILAGQTSASFTVSAVDDAIVDGTQPATITASAATFAAGTDAIDVSDDDVPTLALNIDLAAMSENGGSSNAAVSRNTDTTSALVVNLASDDTSEATVPATVTILAGQTSANFTVNAVDDGIVDGTQLATITASFSGFIDGTDAIDVTDDDAAPQVLSVELNADQADPLDLPKCVQPTSWTKQHSSIASIVVTFNEPMTLDVDDIRLTNLGINAPQVVDQVVDLVPGQFNLSGSVLTLSFATGDLDDGVYRIEVLQNRHRHRRQLDRW